MRHNVKSCCVVGALFAMGWTAAGAAFAAPGDANAAAADPPLAGYSAVFELVAQLEVDQNLLVDASGRYVSETTDVCDGWALSERMVVNLDVNETAVLSDTRVSGWVSADGDRYRFTTKHLIGGESIQESAGEARRGEKDVAVTFTKPTDKTLSLPADVEFPVIQVRSILAAAARGEQIYSAPFFDGADETQDKPYYRSTTVFGGSGVLSEADAADSAVEGLKGLVGMTYHRGSIAFYPAGGADASADSVPESEISFRLFDNGFADELTFRFQGLTIQAHLSELTLAPDPGC